jgi:hypothetical protein
MIVSYIVALGLYWLAEGWLRNLGYPKEPVPPFIPAWKKGMEWTIWVSPGFWLARCKKNRIDAFPKHLIKRSRRRFIVANNKHNLYFSALVCLLAFIPSRGNEIGFWVNLLWAFATFRFISRTVEIALAFGSDVLLRAKNRSGLHKHMRIRLAFNSYVELFLLAAPVYYAHAIAVGRIEAIKFSLFVGTLTNVGDVFKSTPLVVNLVFLHVIATMSLVILSLAVYVSRAK